MRETKVELENELSLHVGWQTAQAGGHTVRKVRMSYILHDNVVRSIESDTVGHIPALIRNMYDPDTRAYIPSDEPCGVILGVPVFRDAAVGDDVLILESDPVEIQHGTH